jgi:hypothetical protein
MDPRPPDAQDGLDGPATPREGWGRHGPVPVVGTPQPSYGYALGLPPRAPGRGTPNAPHQTCAELP